MAKGFFTQGVCVLLDRPVTLDDVAPLLRDFQVVDGSRPPSELQ